MTSFCCTLWLIAKNNSKSCSTIVIMLFFARLYFISIAQSPIDSTLQRIIFIFVLF